MRVKKRILLGNQDITSFVSDISYSHGMGILSREDAASTIKGVGIMTLTNLSLYWDSSRLNDLVSNVLVIEVDGSQVVRCRVKFVTPILSSDTIRCTLESALAPRYEDRVVFGTSSPTTDIAINTATGDLITFKTTLQGWQTDGGVGYTNNIFRYIRDFGIFADAFIAEDWRGHFLGVLPRTENRANDYTIHLPTMNARETNALTSERPEWRRDSQRWVTINSQTTEAQTGAGEASVTYRKGSLLTSVATVKRNSGTGLTAEYEAKFPVRTGAGVPSDRVITKITWKLSNSNLSGSERGLGWVTQNTSVSNTPFRTFDYDAGSSERKEGVAECDVEWSGLAADQYAVNQMRLAGDLKFTVFYRYATPTDAFTTHTPEQDTTTVLAEPKSFLPDMPFEINTGQEGKLHQKLTYWNTFTPRITRLVFPLSQRLQSQLNTLKALRVCDRVQLTSDIQRFPLSAKGWLLYKHWRLSASRGIDEVEMHFLTTQELSRSTDYLKTANDFITVGRDRIAFGTPRFGVKIDAPAGLNIIAKTETTLRLQWNAVSGADWYEVRSSSSGSWARIGTSLAATRSHTFTGLTKNTSYTLQVRAGNNQGTSSISTLRSTTSEGITAPDDMGTTTLDAPTGLRLGIRSSNSIGLTWTKVTGATSYEVRVDNGSWTDIGDNDVYFFMNLTPATEYDLYVRAVNNNGHSDSATIQSSTRAAAVGFGAPTGFGAGIITATTVATAWTKNSEATSYEVRVTNGSWTDVGDVDEYVFTGLTANTSYVLQVRSVKGTTTSDGVAITITTEMSAQQQLPTAPTNLVLRPDNNRDGGNLKCRWDAVEGATSYEYQWTWAKGSWPTAPDTSGTWTTTTNTQFDTGRDDPRSSDRNFRFIINVRAINNAGTGPHKQLRVIIRPDDF